MATITRVHNRTHKFGVSKGAFDQEQLGLNLANAHLQSDSVGYAASSGANMKQPKVEIHIEQRIHASEKLVNRPEVQSSNPISACKLRR